MAEIENVFDGQPQGFMFMRQARDAFRYADVADLQRFQIIASQTASGTISVGDAAREAADIDDTFARLIVFAKEWGLVALLVALVALYIQVKEIRAGDVTDAAILHELRRSNAHDEQILDELRRLNGPNEPPPPVAVQRPARTAAAARPRNRHERRTASASTRAAKKGPPRL